MSVSSAQAALSLTCCFLAGMQSSGEPPTWDHLVKGNTPGKPEEQATVMAGALYPSCALETAL